MVDATKKQGNAVEALRVELDRKNKEKSELVRPVYKLVLLVLLCSTANPHLGKNN